ncbi:MAG TPA: hypothetical protein VF458_12170 [Ktedonobacteraceae bacterium]
MEVAKNERKKHDEGSYVYNLLTQDIKTKQEQLAKFREECASASSITAATAIYKARVIEFLDFLNVMRGKYDKATFQEKRNAIDVLGVMATVAALAPEKRHRGIVPTLADIKSRMTITYSPIFSGAGVQSSPEDLRLDLRAVTQKIRPDWDITKPELVASWEGDKQLHYPYKKSAR